MKKGVIFLCLLFNLFLVNTSEVKGAGSYQLNFDAASDYQVGDLIEVTVFVSELNEIKGGLIGLQGTISYDETKLQYIGLEGLYSANWTKYQPYTAIIGQIRYCDYDDTAGTEPITGNVPVMKITFKALEEGNTEIWFANNVRTVGSDIEFKTVNSVLGANKTINIASKVLETIPAATTTVISSDSTSKSSVNQKTNNSETIKENLVNEEIKTEEIEETEEIISEKTEKKETKKSLFQIIKTFFQNIFRR